MVKQKMGGREELAGRDVILIHTLLKNTVSAKGGGRADEPYSDACNQTMGIDPVAQGLVKKLENFSGMNLSPLDSVEDRERSCQHASRDDTDGKVLDKRKAEGGHQHAAAAPIAKQK